ncbi:MAG: 2-oxoglutarate dehydrogenase E1 component [SAR324 cluster bacterium]|nr:2-oxoglutarate dehydrogenase E1 component [SAR324 cluster bacterium]
MRSPEDFPTVFSGVNAEFLENLFRQYQDAPESFSEEWRRFFAWMQNGGGKVAQARPAAGGGAEPALRQRPLDDAEGSLSKQSKVHQLINTYRNFGHTGARLDPLGRPHMQNPPDLSLAYFGLNEADLDESFSTGTLVAPPLASLRDILQQVSQTYCGSVGAEFMYIRDHAQRSWLREAMEGSWNQPRFDKESKIRILSKLAHAEMFEKFLHTKFVGQKRFSLEGAETLIVMLDALVEEGSELGVDTVVFGMPHRGRLNTLVNVMEKRLEMVFAEFKDVIEVNELTGSGDVKYHLGYSSDRETQAGRNVHLSLAFNPSHLEAVNPVVEGYVRAKQDRLGDRYGKAIVPVLMHGDAAFAGQGSVMECLNLSQLQGYKTGGTIHIIVNNQVGFTTPPRMARSFVYPSDVVKMLNIPVLHVNGDDPEAATHVMKLAVAFRQYFHTDILVNLFCYRRHGHNEMDEPSFTQPLTYKIIKELPSTLEIYAGKLLQEGSITAEEERGIRAAYRQELDAALEAASRDTVEPQIDTLAGTWSGLGRAVPRQIVITEVEKDTLHAIGKAITEVPKDFTPHPRLVKLLQARRGMMEGKQPIDWGMGELLAYGSLVWEGFNVRLSGQDSSRGTFSHRHANLVDVTNGKDYVTLQHLKEGQGKFEVYDSPLSEIGVLGFEFGYSLNDPYCLVLWEAQFGDFANGAQMIIDQFIAASEEKWLRMNGLVMLLPHGFEGQGPEHSSARLERFLQMCADGNMQVCSPSTPAQMFHLLRRQLHRSFRKPLIVMSPKSLLRHPRAVSSPEDLIKGSFRELLFDRKASPRNKVRRIIFCSGKVYYDLTAERERLKRKDLAIVRMEQLYPFPDDQVSLVLKQYPAAKEVRWVQEEPKNMGAWTFVEPLLRDLLPASLTPGYVGREAAASPAAGSHRVHDAQQEALVAAALA